MKKIYALEGIRGLAVLLVFLDHGSVGNWPKLGQAAVYIFFILSAFLMFYPFFKNGDEKLTKKELTKYYIRRFMRIYPLYFVITIIILILRNCYIGEGLASPFNISYNFLLLQDVGLRKDMDFRLLSVTWTLIIEFQFYIFVPLIYYMISRKEKYITYFIILIGILGWFSRYYFMSEGIAHYGKPWFFMYLDLFSFGMMLAYLYVRKELIEVKVKNIFSILILIFYIYFMSFSDFGKYSVEFLYVYYIPIFGVFTFVIFNILLTDDKNIISKFFTLKPLVYMGSIGYSFYLIHLLILGDFFPYISFGHDTIVALVLSFITVLILSILSKKFIEDTGIKVGKYLTNRVDCGKFKLKLVIPCFIVFFILLILSTYIILPKYTEVIILDTNTTTTNTYNHNSVIRHSYKEIVENNLLVRTEEVFYNDYGMVRKKIFKNYDGGEVSAEYIAIYDTKTRQIVSEEKNKY